MHNLANCLNNQGRFAEADKLYRQTLEIYRRVLGEEHPDTLGSMNDMAMVLDSQGHYAEAEKLIREALSLGRKLFGNEHRSTLESLILLVGVLNVEGKSDEARPLVAELFAHERRITEKPSATANALNQYAYDLLTIKPADLRDLAAALQVAERAVEKSGGKDPSIMDTLALAQQMTGDIDAAVETETKALALLPAEPSAMRPFLESSLAEFLIEQKSYAKAEPLLLSAYQQLKDNPQSIPDEHTKAIQRLIDLYTAWDAAEPGKNYDAKVAEWREKLPELETQPLPEDGK